MNNILKSIELEQQSATTDPLYPSILKVNFLDTKDILRLRELTLGQEQFNTSVYGVSPFGGIDIGDEIQFIISANIHHLDKIYFTYILNNEETKISLSKFITMTRMILDIDFNPDNLPKAIDYTLGIFNNLSNMRITLMPNMLKSTLGRIFITLYIKKDFKE